MNFNDWSWWKEWSKNYFRSFFSRCQPYYQNLDTLKFFVETAVLLLDLNFYVRKLLLLWLLNHLAFSAKPIRSNGSNREPVQIVGKSLLSKDRVFLLLNENWPYWIKKSLQFKINRKRKFCYLTENLFSEVATSENICLDRWESSCDANRPIWTSQIRPYSLQLRLAKQIGSSAN